MEEQYIVICLKDKTKKDPATYVQTTRKRFSYDEAIKYANTVAPSRDACVVKVKPVKLSGHKYPLFLTENFCIWCHGLGKNSLGLTCPDCNGTGYGAQ
jgi:hypothetical protein